LTKNVAVFVDVANLYYSARGLEVDVDYVALLKAATKGRDLIRAYAYSGLDPENENQRKFIDFLNKNGYKVVHKDIRKFGDGRVKANLDIELVVDVFRLADRMDIAVIVSGDGDFAPAIRALQDKGVRCEVISFRPNTSSDLIAVADEFIDIMKIIGIGRGKEADKASKVMSAPPMPAKEVTPEFGFREAPAAVAAAAMAALRGGAEGRPAARGRGRGRGRVAAAEPVSSEAPAAEPVGATPTLEGAAAGEPGAELKRKRRRRGGRGRGRGRGHDEGSLLESAEPAESAEIGWTEFDDISQIGETEDEFGTASPVPAASEITFGEADAEALAELGLPAAKPRRSTARAKPAAKPEGPAAPEEAPSEPAPATRPRRSGTRARATAAAAPRPAPAADAPAPAAASPRPRTRSRRPTGAEGVSAPGGAPADASGDQTEGIWQRFTSGRTRTRRSKPTS